MTGLLSFALPLLETNAGPSWVLLVVVAVIVAPLVFLWDRAYRQKKRDGGEEMEDGGGSAAAM